MDSVMSVSSRPSRLTKGEARERLGKLRREIERHRYLYHVLDRTEISDAALDSLKQELKTLEDRFPDLVTPDSPTQRVGGQPLDQFRKVRHASPMLSLEDALTGAELEAWLDRLKKLVPRAQLDFYAEVKIDGLSIALVYEHGLLVRGATRGDGQVGEDVTQNVKTIEAIPLRISIDKLPPSVRARAAQRLEVRGEVYLRKDVLAALNREQAKQGEPLFANPRNAAAGAVRQLDPRVTASRRLSFYAWDLPTDLGQRTHQESHELAKLLGFPTNPLNRHCRDLAAVKAYHDEIGRRRERLPYQLDGIVVNVDDRLTVAKLGVVGKAPRGALAFKYPAEQATARVEEIVVQVGRTGALTPVAHLTPVAVAGTTVSRATLHNQDEIERLDVRIGDTVIVEKAGDIIPDVVQVLKNLRPRRTKPYHLPRRCPICQTAVVRRPGEVIHYCPNRRCPARQRETLYHFVGQHGFDMAGVGPNIVDVLVDEGLVKDLADLFTVKPDQLVGLPLFAEKKAANVVAAIQASRRIPLARFLVALGIRHVGEETAVDLAQHFGSLERLMAANREAVNAVPNIGDVVADSLINFFADQRHRQLIAKLESYGVTVTPAERLASTKLKGKTFVVTGTLEMMTRQEAHRLVRLHGGEVASSVSKKTSYLVVGSEPGSKLRQARGLGVLALTEREFLKLIGRH